MCRAWLCKPTGCPVRPVAPSHLLIRIRPETSRSSICRHALSLTSEWYVHTCRQVRTYSSVWKSQPDDLKEEAYKISCRRILVTLVVLWLQSSCRRCNYITLTLMKPGAFGVLDRYGIQSCLVLNDEPLSVVLGLSSDWKKVYMDGTSAIFVRKTALEAGKLN